MKKMVFCHKKSFEGGEKVDESNFHTMKGYQLIENSAVTPAIEDYLEMICRIHKVNDVIRVNELAKLLHVRQSSVTKMLNNLNDLELVEYQKYGYIKPTVKGLELGNYLLYRHSVLNVFLCYINKTESETEQVEKIEHFFDRRTIDNLNKFNSSL